MIIIRKAKLKDEPACNALAKRSIYTRDFQNPSLSFKAKRKIAFTEKQVYVADMDGVVVGFLWSCPMKPKHMPFCNVYFSAVDDKLATGLGSINRRMAMKALEDSLFGCIEFVCEHGNEPTHRYYIRAHAIPEFFGRGTRFEAVRQGVVGKDNRPYTRWRISR
jgi:hypothetical protein